jgi:uncharacterized protein
MSVFVSPGVYTVERDFSLYVPSLSTTSFGVVGSASKGPMNTATLITDEGTLVSTFGSPSASHLQMYAALRYLRRGRQLWYVRVGTGEATAGGFLRNLQNTNNVIQIDAASSGVWGNNISVSVVTGTASGTYKVSVLYNSVVVEVYDNVYVGASWSTNANYILTRINSGANVSEYITASMAGTNETTLRPGVTIPLTGGLDGVASTSDIVGSVGSPPAVPATGLQIFRNPEAIDVNLLAVPGNTNSSVINELLDICSSRGDCMCLLDTPYGDSVTDAVDWHNGLGGATGDPGAALNSSYGACYYPWLQVYDGFNDANVYVPPTGHVAQVIAYTDYVADPWWAPAGLNRAKLSDVLQVHHSATQGERDYMYSSGNAVNPIVSLPGLGTVIYGQRTLQRAATALDRINVRRMVLYLRKVIATAARTLQFEPNDLRTWARFRGLVNPTLDGLKARRGITDYKVICDSTVNTAAVIARNELKARILLQPTRTAEIINIEFVLLATGASFEEF